MSGFEDTRWSVVVAARGSTTSARVALDHLCRAYRSPVFAYVRHGGRSREDAEDLTQAFFVHFLERGCHEHADPARGRFRSLLLTSLRRFVIDQHDHDHASKRYAHMVGGHAIENTADGGESPEDVFTRRWLATVVGHAMGHLQEEWRAAGKEARFGQFAPFLLEPTSSSELKDMAMAAGMRSNTLAVQIHRMRQRLRQLVRLELLQTVGSEEALDEELAELRRHANADVLS